MAASHNASTTPLSNRYRGDGDVFGSRLPSGGCNYTNLSLGVNAARCGCRRFWDKSLGNLNGDGGSGSTGFCMCEHHACYHDHTPSKRESESLGVVGSNTPRQRPRVPDQSIQDGNPEEHLDLGPAAEHISLPDSLSWSRYIQGSTQGLPAIPSQCLLPSENGSVTSGSQSAYYRPFGGQGLETLSHITKTTPGDAQAQVVPSRMQIYEDHYGVQHLQSLTDVATPSVRTSQIVEVDVAKHAATVAGRLQPIAESQASQASTPLQIASQESTPQIPIKQSDSCLVKKDLSDGREMQMVLHEQQLREPNDIRQRLDNHEQRLDQLENVSFTHPAIEDLQESDEHMEIRVVAVEYRLEEMEKALAAQNDTVSISTRQSIEGSFTSNTSSAMVVAVRDHVDSSRVEALEAQVAELQAIAPPSYSRPWEVEVVILPFGTQLMGIWSTQDSMTPRSKNGSSSIAPDDWTQTQNNSVGHTEACLGPHDQARWERCAGDLVEGPATWLMAKACGVNSRVDNRLRSRGLVKTVQICGPDARDVQTAMLKAFADLPVLLAEDPFAGQNENLSEVPRTMRNYIGLQAPWIPLRKLHRDSCLRFLNSAEMLTPALWTVPFLSSSVAMRHSGIRRLYVTQRDSYIQHHSENGADWTWQKLRQLPRVYPETSSINHTPEADAQEECWAYDPRLDPPASSHASLHSSFHSQISQLSIESLHSSPDLQEVVGIEHEPMSPSDHFSSAAVSPAISTPRTSVPPTTTICLSPLRHRNPFFRPLHHRRTISMSSTVPIKAEASSQNKRRIASFERERETQPSSPIAAAATTSSEAILSKRQRISRSPSRPRNTPRWSVGSPSPFPFHDVERGTTPFAYATPHSNAPYVPRSGVDVDVYEDDDSDYHVDHDHDHDEGDDDEDEEGRESTTDASADEERDQEDEEEEEGFEHNALSDYEHDHGEWHGVQDDPGAIRDSGLTHESGFAVGGGGRSRQQQQQHQQAAAIIIEDADSEMSDSPSEYPSTQPHHHLLPPKGVVAQTEPLQLQLVQHKARPSGGLYERRQTKRDAGVGVGLGLGFRIHVDEEGGEGGEEEEG